MDISRKTNRVLHFISLCLILILIRTWYLGVVQHDYHVMQVEKAPEAGRSLKKPRGPRSTIGSGSPWLSIKSNITPLSAMPTSGKFPAIVWKKTEDGKQSQGRSTGWSILQSWPELLSRELGLDVTKIEDIIHGQGCDTAPYALCH